MRRSLWIIPLLVGSLAAGQAPTGNTRVFLLAGQSNMAGRGLVEAPDREPLPRVFTLDANHAWIDARDPLHFDKPIAGTGLWRTFAMRVLEATPQATLVFVPAAVGGSPIDSWQPGAFYEPTRSHPWDDAMARVGIARARGQLVAILWHQGESDATPELAPGYEAKLHALIARFRTALSAPELPFIVGQLGQFPEAPWDEPRRQVDAAHRALPGKVPHTAFVSSDSLHHTGDKVHFDRASLHELGRRYAEAYLQLERRTPAR